MPASHLSAAITLCKGSPQADGRLLFGEIAKGITCEDDPSPVATRSKGEIPSLRRPELVEESKGRGWGAEAEVASGFVSTSSTNSGVRKDPELAAV